MPQSSQALILLVVSFFALSCEKNPVGPGELTSTDDFLVALRQQGASVTRGDVLPLGIPCFSTNGRVVSVNTGSVNVFEYPTAAAAETDASKVSPDGSYVRGDSCAAVIEWVGPPHFYKSARLIVTYAGSADDVLRPLEAVLGPPFARR